MESTITAPVTERRIASNGVFGMIFVLATEAMFFAGLISAYIVNRANVMVWPPAGQPRLPVGATAFNTLILIVSAVTLYLFGRQFRAPQQYVRNNTRLLTITLLLGTIFLIIQGTEWIQLLNFGLTTHSSIYGAFFYTLIGMHGIHVLAGLIILSYLLSSLGKLKSDESKRNKIAVCSMYWYFVVMVWPILYALVYLS